MSPAIYSAPKTKAMWRASRNAIRSIAPRTFLMMFTP